MAAQVAPQELSRVDVQELDPEGLILVRQHSSCCPVRADRGRHSESTNGARTSGSSPPVRVVRATGCWSPFVRRGSFHSTTPARDEVCERPLLCG
jgi:hypothetical protein